MLRLAGSGAVSKAAQMTFDPSVILLLMIVFFIKNMLLMTSEPSRTLGKGDRIMDKVVKLARTLLASVAETIGGLGISHLATDGPLA